MRASFAAYTQHRFQLATLAYDWRWLSYFCGADAFLQKPFNVFEVLMLMDELIID